MSPRELTAAPEGEPLRVLLAEDDPTNQLVASRLLTRRGHSVVIAVNGRIALETLGRERFDLVLMDMSMPEMSGVEATLAIRAAEAGTGRRVPILALTANTKQSAAEQCLAAGMDAHLAKPFRAPELFAAIERVVRRERPAPPAIDVEALLVGVDGDLDLLRELLGLFHREIPGQLAHAKSALESGDADALGAAGHRLKGALANFAAKGAAEAAGRLEHLARAGDLPGARLVIAELERELGRMGAEISALEASGRFDIQPAPPVPMNHS